MKKNVVVVLGVLVGLLVITPIARAVWRAL